MNAIVPKPSRGHRWLQAALLCAATVAGGWASAQKIDDVPPAANNNIAPNFMLMIDDSGSMSNIVQGAPWNSSTIYTNCATPVAAGFPGSETTIDINTAGGLPRFSINGSGTYKHSSITSGTGTSACFSNTANYKARLTGQPTAPGGYLYALYSGQFLNWYLGAYDGPTTGWADRKKLTTGQLYTRIEATRIAALNALNNLPLPDSTGKPQIRVGLSTYASSRSGGMLLVPVSDYTTSQKSCLQGGINSLDAITNTPLASTFADIARYMATGYNGNITLPNATTVNIDTFLQFSGADSGSRNAGLVNQTTFGCPLVTTAQPIQAWCQRSSLFAMTDGRPQGDRVFDNNSNLRDYDGDCSGSNAANCKQSNVTLPYDRKPTRTYESAGSDYMDDVAKAMYDIDWRPDLSPPSNYTPGANQKNNITTYVIGFADAAIQNDPLLQNTALQGGGQFIVANDAPSLTAAFLNVITDARSRDAAAAAVAVTSAQITSGSIGYASSYNTGNWYGDLEAYSLDTTTGLKTGSTIWNARDKLLAQSASTRNIASYNGSAGVAFSTANGANFRTNASTLSDGVINYIRGDRTGEGTTYRTRTFTLGDAINAEPVVVNYASGPVVFLGANDGMLHAIDGRIAATATTAGQELWAYVPRLLHNQLANFAAIAYSHQYFVDATPATAPITGAGAMTNILVGGLGKGGAGYFALDVTTGTAATEADAASKVKWEFKPTNMGYSFGTPLIVNTSAGYRVAVASGYRNDTNSGGLGGDGRGRVWVLDPATGSILKTFTTPAGYGSATNPLGLTHLGKTANITPDVVVRYVYAGDLQGNMWRFDLEAADGSSPVLIAQLRAPDGTAQPVTAPPVVGPVAGSSTKFYVYIGTGQYLSLDDVPGTSSPNATATQTQTVYGIIDDTSLASPSLPNIRGSNGSSCPTGGGTADFVCQAFTASGSNFTATANSVDTGSKRGFYSDVPVANGRVNNQVALSSGGTLVFVVNAPSNVQCIPGGTSYFFQLSGANGGAVATTLGGSTYFQAGTFLANALASRAVIVITGTGTRGLFRLSDKSTQSVQINETPPCTGSGCSSSGASLFKRIYKRALN